MLWNVAPTCASLRALARASGGGPAKPGIWGLLLVLGFTGKPAETPLAREAHVTEAAVSYA